MAAENIALYPSRNEVPRYIYREYERAGYRLVVVIPRSSLNGIHEFDPELGIVYVNPSNASCRYVIEVIRRRILVGEIILRQYIDYGSFIMADIPRRVSHLVVLGDTHHLVGLIANALKFLRSNKPTVLCSYANPGDALIIGKILGLEARQICVYPPSLVMRNTLGGVSERDIEISKYEVYKQKVYGMCATLSEYQIPRSKMLRYLMLNKEAAQYVELFEFISEPGGFMKNLGSMSALIVPTNGSQVSPQTVTAAGLGLNVISDCEYQLLLHDDYQDVKSAHKMIHEFNFSESLTGKTEQLVNGRVKPIGREYCEALLASAHEEKILSLNGGVLETNGKDIEYDLDKELSWFDMVIGIRSRCNPRDLGSIAVSEATSGLRRDFLRIRGLRYDF